MSGGTFYLAAAAGVGFAAAVAFVGLRALRQARTVEVFERPAQPAQPYMLQVNPPSEKVHALSLPMPMNLDKEFPLEKQA
jgi:hypothetical protein